ncbi:hypothetical protein HK100_009957 [Physocladia obscura]|uniref:Uncharacterized protein n=1 Tax=Physocladia obscura TaxID=109957 RepID=A0AAD5T948_9FUNG|nr:hypothetical protein HK100_009957 [Physocladia obscura]
MNQHGANCSTTATVQTLPAIHANNPDLATIPGAATIPGLVTTPANTPCLATIPGLVTISGSATIPDSANTTILVTISSKPLNLSPDGGISLYDANVADFNAKLFAKVQSYLVQMIDVIAPVPPATESTFATLKNFVHLVN